ncbi:MAG: GDSL-type esterase/lipase family protein [Lachnospiraceae bacterium]|nr:GDSL-type esterase/lipase family protein [Lachnospiraceae bacterium]
MRFKILLIVLCFTGLFFSSAKTEAAQTIGEQTDILFWGETITDPYSTRDITYPDKAKGFNSSGVYKTRKKVTKDGGTSYLTLEDGVLKVESQVWKEASPDPFYAYYQNTTEFYWKAENADYEVTVVLSNPTLESYSAFLRSDTQTQSWTKKVKPGAEVTLTGTISVIDGELCFSILADSSAVSEKQASLQAVYVKEIRITRLATEEKGETPTIFIAGDSTSAYYSSGKSPWEGWGQEFYRYFTGKNTVRQKSYTELGFNTEYLNGYREYKMSNLTIENWSVPGESTTTFLSSGKWDGILNKAKPGDYVFVQFGHNDSVKSKGVKYTSLSDYRKNLKTFIKSCEQRGVTCVLLSPIPKYSFTSSGNCQIWVNSYRKAMKSVAAANNVPFLDIGYYGSIFLTNIGKSAAKPYYLIVGKGKYSYFPDGTKDYIHLQKKGADKFAQIVAARITKNSKLKALASYLDVDTNYYSGITRTTSITKKSKSGKSTWRLYWKKVKYAKYYKIYIYSTKKKSYRYITKRSNTKAKITGYSTKKKYKFQVRAVY